MKKYFALLSILVMTGNIVADIPGEDMAWAAAALLGAGTAQYGAKKLSENKIVQNVGSTVAMDPLDAGRVLALSGGLYSISIIANDKIKNGLREMAWRAPIAAVVIGATQTKTFQEIAQHVPVIGSCVTCENSGCEGVCNKCKLTKTVMSLGIWRIVDTALTSYLNKN